MQATRSATDQLWSKVRKTTTGCWEYTGHRNEARGGYGQVHIDGRPRRAHRVAWELTHGPIPEGLLVRHKCDNPPCINPDHLELGTHRDNTDDAVTRDRIARGGRLPHTKLSPGAVRAIKADLRNGETHLAIANAYGVSRTLVGRIANGERWTEVA